LEVDRIAESMLAWDVYNGVARRSWSGNQNAQETIVRAMANCNNLKVTVPNQIFNQ
jgi:urocanate hydratase